MQALLDLHKPKAPLREGGSAPGQRAACTFIGVIALRHYASTFWSHAVGTVLGVQQATHRLNVPVTGYYAPRSPALRMLDARRRRRPVLCGRPPAPSLSANLQVGDVQARPLHSPEPAARRQVWHGRVCSWPPVPEWNVAALPLAVASVSGLPAHADLSIDLQVDCATTARTT